jgi:hypothetical protein
MRKAPSFWKQDSDAHTFPKVKKLSMRFRSRRRDRLWVSEHARETPLPPRATAFTGSARLVGQPRGSKHNRLLQGRLLRAKPTGADFRFA